MFQRQEHSGEKRTFDMNTEAEGVIGNLYNFLNIKGLKSRVLKRFILFDTVIPLPGICSLKKSCKKNMHRIVHN